MKLNCVFLSLLLALITSVATAAPGDLDTSFGSGGKVLTSVAGVDDRGYAVALQSDGMIVVAGHSDNHFAVARFTSTGALDASFGSGGKVITSITGGTDFGYGVAVQSDGKIVVTGTGNTSSVIGLVRYTSSGALDASFGSGGIVTTAIGTNAFNAGYSLVLQSDGKILVAGASGGSDNDFALVRYTASGVLDASFGNGGIVTTPIRSGSGDTAQSVALQSDGKIVVAGASSGDFAVVRYASTGALDTTFGTNGIVTTPIGPGDDRAYRVVVQSDGKILTAGYALFPNGQAGPQYDFALARYTSTGALDTSFGNGGKLTTPVGPTTGLFGSQDQARGLAVQSDGKIIAAGFATPTGFVGYFAVVRYTSTGVLDATFGTNGVRTTTIVGVDDEGYSMALQPDGKIVVAGWSESDGTAGDKFAMVRYLGDTPPAVPSAPALLGSSGFRSARNRSAR